MSNTKSVTVGLVGFLLVVIGVGLWVFGDATSQVVSIPLALTGTLWAPLLWFLGIIVMLSAALANTLRFKDFVVWLVVLVVGYLAVFAVLVSVTSLILP